MPGSEQVVPLNDVREMKRSNSRGSNHDVDLAHEGMEDTLDYRLQAVCPTEKKKISLWHDVSLVHMDPEKKEETPYLNFVCEIPKFTRYVLFRRRHRRGRRREWPPLFLVSHQKPHPPRSVDCTAKSLRSPRTKTAIPSSKIPRKANSERCV